MRSLLHRRLIYVTAQALLAFLSPPSHGAEANLQQSEVVAVVNGESITSDEVQWEMREPHLIPGMKADKTIGAALNRVIDRRLLAQEALSLDLNKIIRVQSVLLAARDDVLARSYIEVRTKAAEQPSSQDILKYYLEHPSLFSSRRIFSIREFATNARPNKADELRERLKMSKSVESFVDSLRIEGVAVVENQAIRPSEQIPLYMLEDLVAMSPGVPAISVAPDESVSVLIIDSSRLEPLEISAASPAIGQFLINEKRRAFFDTEIGSLKRKANIRIYGNELK